MVATKKDRGVRWLVALTLLLILVTAACDDGSSQPLGTAPDQPAERPGPQGVDPADGESLIFEGASYHPTASRPVGSLSSSDVEELGPGKVGEDAVDVFRLRSGGENWEVLSRSGGSWVTWEPVALQEARRQLTERLGGTEAQLSVNEVERVEWPDACLGAAGDDEVCAAVVTAGFRIVLRARGGEYVYHSDLAGNVRRE